MPNPFSITTATDTVRLDAQGRGSTTYTVSNISRQLRRGRARLVPSAPGQASWLSVDGEAERNFTADGTHQYTVRVAVPPGVPPGRSTFGLDVISVENPDEEWSQGPRVGFEVAPSQPAKKPFPWWIVAVVLAVLLVGGLVLWLVLKNRRVEVGHGEICNPGEMECAAGLVCSDIAEGVKKCLGNEGFAGCGKPEDCVSGLICRSGTCARPAGVLEPCAVPENCAAGLTCARDTGSGRGICVGKAGFSPCDSDRTCADGLACQGKTCRGRLHFTPCSKDGECGEGLTCAAGACLGAPGFPGCSSPEDCAAGLQCHEGACRGPLHFATCDAPTDCVPGLVCANGRCLLPPGAPCASDVADVDCSTGHCEMRWTDVGGPVGVIGVRIPAGFFCQ